jgi:Na+/H+ antiporter NhaC
MKPVMWMVGAGALSWLGGMALFGVSASADVAAGVLGPLVAVFASWVAIERTMKDSPERMTAVLLRAFAAKMLFFGAYVVVMVTGLALRPIPFMTTFTTSFVALYAVEALALQRLTADGLRASR